jgi:hypothetical protein
MDHVISEGNRIWAGSERENTWMIYHDHLTIWWEKESQDYLKTLPCPIEGNPNQTWYDRQIKICGENNDKVSFRYKGRLPGDSPELMPLDCHLFADVQEGAAKNVALTYHLKEGDEDFACKYSFATPTKVYEALQRTIVAGCPSPNRIGQDVKRIFEETLQCIVEAQGCYIEDSSKKIERSGVRAEAAAAYKRETLPVDVLALETFNKMVANMESGGGVSFVFDKNDVAVEEVCNDTLTTVLVADDDDDDDDNGNLVYEAEQGVGDDEPAC